jgi:hypothetical protein
MAKPGHKLAKFSETDLVGEFRNALLAVYPTMQKLAALDDDLTTYDEFDRLAETMWEVIVQNSLMWKYKLEHPPLIPRYGFAQWADLSDGFIETSSLQHGMHCRFVQFSGNRDFGPQPFNVVIGVNEFEEKFMFQYSPDLQFRWMHPGMPKPGNPV